VALGWRQEQHMGGDRGDVVEASITCGMIGGGLSCKCWIDSFTRVLIGMESVCTRSNAMAVTLGEEVMDSHLKYLAYFPPLLLAM
jgi:type IV secretory pathway TrbD component